MAIMVSVEGVGGAGKTTQADRLAEYLSAAGLDIVSVREPGGTLMGESVRSLLLTQRLTPWAEAALFAAARAQLVEEVLRPSLCRGATVVCDRFVDSSLVYQGVLHGLGIEPVLELNMLASRGFLPDVTVLLDIDPGVAGERRAKHDVIETADASVRAVVAKAYLELSARFPERIQVVNASGPVDDVAARVAEAVDHALQKSARS